MLVMYEMGLQFHDPINPFCISMLYCLDNMDIQLLIVLNEMAILYIHVG